MATISGLSKARMLAMEAATIISGAIQGDNLILTKRDGTTVNAGNVRGPKGDQGLQGTALNAYPVGALFFSTVATDPSTLLGGGTWERYGKGRTIVSQDETQPEFDTADEVGGEKTVTLTKAQLPLHKHNIDHDHSNASVGMRSAAGGGTLPVRGNTTADGSAAVNIPAYTGFSGDGSADGVNGEAHNNMPPYIVTYVWRRTA